MISVVTFVLLKKSKDQVCCVFLSQPKRDFKNGSSEMWGKVKAFLIFILVIFLVRTCCSHIQKLPKCDRWIGSVGMTSDSCYSHLQMSYSGQFSGIQTSPGLSGSSAAVPGKRRPGGPGLRPGSDTKRQACPGGRDGPPGRNLDSRGSERMRWL